MTRILFLCTTLACLELAERLRQHEGFSLEPGPNYIHVRLPPKHQHRLPQGDPMFRKEDQHDHH